MGIFDTLFGSQPAPAQATPSSQQTPVTPGNIPANAGAATSTTNASVPASTEAAMNTPNTDNPLSALDAYNDLWKNDPNAAAQENQPIINIDPAKVREAASKNDFTQALTPELARQIESGGPEAMKAMMQVMNAMAQKSFGDSATVSAKLLEDALTKQRESFEAKLPSIIKQHSLKESLANDNPIFKHPAAAPVLESLQAQIAVKFPNATVSEQQKMAKDYLLSLANAANPQQKDSQQQAKAAEEDWSTFL